MTKSLIGLILILLTGCVSEHTQLRNERGQVVQCNNDGWGWIGAPVAMSQHADCIKKAKEAGYSENPPTQTP